MHAWVDELPEPELGGHYRQVLNELDQEDLSMLAAWHASLEAVGQPVANTDFLLSVFPSLGEYRREALKIATAFRGEGDFEAGVGEAEILVGMLPQLSRTRATELAAECVELYVWDRLGTDT